MRDCCDHGTVELALRAGEGADHVQEEHRPQLIALICHLVLVGVVEEEARPLLPMADLRPHANPAGGGRLRDDQPEVIAQQALVGAAVRRDALAGGEDREHRGQHPRHALDQGRGLRAERSAELRAVAVAVEEERLPAVIIGQRALVGGDLLEARQLLASAQQPLELGAHQRSATLKLSDPAEAGGLEEGRLAAERAAPEMALDRRQQPFAGADRERRQALAQEPSRARHRSGGLAQGGKLGD